MVKPKVHGEKYTLAINIIRNGECGKQAAARADTLSTHDAYTLLSYFGWIWNNRIPMWEKEKPVQEKRAKPNNSLFGDLPVKQHLAVRIVTHSDNIDNLIESTLSLYALMDCTLLHITGPVPSKRPVGKSMAYLYFALPR